ncbi:2-octaprenyl-6-methoxyphenol hydroxylase [Chelatococcus caeni]|uniref:2-octaprenyl-6-methoxyphenol hydroxylase n=1 Tax=Chelatococcus caeni TaxID=1348468 RepID=A0A840C3X7_9HYPH|nr:ubiquinone biosynthesis hydroxylase [Chelatococcus caeni]MBB4020185.1 2-octaprenyl-6-methoxyphenol hydroxylase [Chelatococcus caeni]
MAAAKGTGRKGSAGRRAGTRAIPPSRRVVIAGGGLAGLALALSLARGGAGGLDITVCDPALARPAPGGDASRASAIAAGARRMLETLGVWSVVAERAEPILDMVITDSRLADPVRPSILSFAGEVAPGEPFAHMVENDDLVNALAAACREAGVTLAAEGIARFVAGPERVLVTTASGAVIEAGLLVAADGARSRLRDMADIGWVGRSYDQVGIVATIGHERPHEGRAIEHFLPSGPFAILPLATRDDRHRSSIVWTERADAADYLLQLPDEDLREEVERRFGLELGEIALLSPARAFPLSIGIARRFVAGRFALVGDAAHVVHPIAGQGLNIGLRDVAVLAETIIDACRLGRDVADEEALLAYERARRFDTVTMGLATDGLNRLFSNDLLPVRLMRDLGLGLVERMPAAKRFFIREAAGLTGAVPRLMRGEAL